MLLRLDANLRAGGAQCSQSALYWEGFQAAGVSQPVLLFLVLAVAAPVLAACFPSCGFPKEHVYECLLQERKLTRIKADELRQIQFHGRNWKGIDFGRQPSCSVNYKCLYRHFE